MNILLYLIWMNILTQMPVILVVLGKNIIFEEYHKARRKRNGINNDKTETHIGTTSNKTGSERSSVAARSSQETSKIIIEGPPSKIENVPVDDLLKALRVMKNTDIIPESHFTKAWEKLKKGKEVDSLQVDDLENMGAFIAKIPDSDLFYLNMKDWNVVEYLGKVTTFSRHKIAIIGASLIKAHGLEILKNHSSINRIYGIICGFDIEVINDIPDEEFAQISGDVFSYLHSCPKDRLRNMLDKATKPTIFGPLQFWKEETLNRTNMLILALTPKELASMQKPVMKGINAETIELMSPEQIMALNSNQISVLNKDAYAMYKKKIYLSSKQVYYKCNINCYILMLVLILTYYNGR